jgi:outer membrane protein TolC
MENMGTKMVNRISRKASRFRASAGSGSARAIALLLLAGMTAWAADGGPATDVSAAGEAWTLERAVAVALTNSPSARIASHRLRAAQAVMKQANSALWPKLQFETSYMRTDNPMMVFGSILNQRVFSPTLDFNDVPDIDNLNLRGVITYPLYAGGAITAQRRAAKAGSAAAEADAQAIRNTLAFEVARTFHNVLKTQSFIEAAEAAVKAFEANLKIAQQRREAGTLLKAEVLDVEVRLTQARENLVRAKNANALAKRALLNLMGLELPDITLIPPAPGAVPEPPPETASTAHRPELDAAAQRATAAEATVRAAKSGWLPKLGLFGSLQADYGFEMDGDGTSWSAGALLQWDLWDGRLTHAKVQEAKANLDTAHEYERQLRLAVNFEAEQARLNLHEARQRLAVTARAVQQAEESVKLTRARFSQGLALATQLIDAETALTAARVRRAEAEADERIAVAALRKALGLPQIESQPNTQ